MNILDRTLKPRFRVKNNKLINIPLQAPLKPTPYIPPTPPKPKFDEPPVKLPGFKKSKAKAKDPRVQKNY